MSYTSGRHFLQIPGPTNISDRILSALSKPTIDHRGPEFAKMTVEIMERLQRVFQTSGPVVIYPSSATGAWEASLVNILSQGDRVLMFETGHFATLWRNVAVRLGLNVDFVESDWRRGVDPSEVEDQLRKDTDQRIKAVAVVHTETSTGVTSRVDLIREAINKAGHPALLLVDAVSSVGAIDYRHEEWDVDVTVCASQKGLLLPPGMSFNAISQKALEAWKSSSMMKSYWDWGPILEANKGGYFSYTPATNLLFGLHEALGMLLEEGLENIFIRHGRYGEAARSAVRAWGLEIFGTNPEEYSNITTAVVMPEGHNADQFRKIVLEKLNMSLGTGLGKVKGKIVRIGHLGNFNELMLAGTLSGFEMGLGLAGIPHTKGGVTAALDYLTQRLRE